MAITVTCPSCQTPWAVVPSIGKAHPGRSSEPVSVLVPDEDVYGNRLGMVRRQSSHWVSAGPSAVLVNGEEGTELVRRWPCLCGQELEHREPAMELVACEPGGTPCSKRANQISPPSDLYVNPRHGGACPCCGHQGTHWVRKDRQGHLPACLTGWDGHWATRPGPR